MAAPVKVARQQTHRLAAGTYANSRRNSSEPSGTFRTLPPEPTPTRAGTLRKFSRFQDLPEPTFRNLPEPTTSGTYASIRRNPPKSSGTFRELASRNLHHATPELPGTFRNLPPEPTPAYAGTFRNLPEPGPGTYTRTHRNSPEPSGTFRNLPPEPAPATRTGTHRSLSGLKTPLAYAVGEKHRKICFGGIPNSNSIDTHTRIYI